jgi:hypothetical protein
MEMKVEAETRKSEVENEIRKGSSGSEEDECTGKEAGARDHTLGLPVSLSLIRE